MCHDADVILAYLSPYSLNYNSIKKFFNELKTWMRKHKTLMKKYEGEFSEFIHMTVQEYNAENNAKIHFCNSFVNCT